MPPDAPDPKEVAIRHAMDEIAYDYDEELQYVLDALWDLAWHSGFFVGASKVSVSDND